MEDLFSVEVFIYDLETRAWVLTQMYELNGKKYIHGPKGKAFLLLIKPNADFHVETIVSVNGLGGNTYRPATFQDRGRITLQGEQFSEDELGVDHYQIGPLVSISFNFWHKGATRSFMNGSSSFDYVKPPAFGIIGIAGFKLEPKPGVRKLSRLSYDQRLKSFERTTPDPLQVLEIRYEELEDLRSLGISIPAEKPSAGLLERENLQAFPLSKVSQEV